VKGKALVGPSASMRDQGKYSADTEEANRSARALSLPFRYDGELDDELIDGSERSAAT
jgi:hypothetical protein